MERFASPNDQLNIHHKVVLTEPAKEQNLQDPAPAPAPAPAPGPSPAIQVQTPVQPKVQRNFSPNSLKYLNKLPRETKTKVI
jgi:hypothetical protein